MSRGFCGLCEQPYDDDFEPHCCEAQACLVAEERKADEVSIRADERARFREEIAKALEAEAEPIASGQRMRGLLTLEQARYADRLADRLRAGTFPPVSASSSAHGGRGGAGGAVAALINR